jgi:glycosyltransferase involved in cell wall biosynthesis
MIIGMEFRDIKFSSMDFSNIELGNPGCGGTHYEFILLAHHLLKINKDYKIILFHYSNNIFESKIDCIKVNDSNEIPFLAKKHGVDILLFWASAHNDKWYQNIDKAQVKAIAWTHNFLSYPDYRNLKKTDFIKRIVAVSREQYELMSGEDIFYKSTNINNMLDCQVDPYNRIISMYHNIVVCIGALKRDKGFHLLSRNWKKILKKVPNAQLYVIGLGNLYNKKIKLGSYGLAESSYENYFMKHLIDENGNILPSVHFLGNLGIEKNEILKKCKVGVCNPNGIETFCISALEMQSYGIPVCSKKRNGLIDSVVNKKTGLLSNSSKGLTKNIIKLLRDDELNLRMGDNAIEHVKKFEGKLIVKEWDNLFNDVINNVKAKKHVKLRNYLSRFKWLRVFIGKIRKIKILCWIPTPSFINYSTYYVMYIVKKKLADMRNHL